MKFCIRMEVMLDHSPSYSISGENRDRILTDNHVVSAMHSSDGVRSVGTFSVSSAIEESFIGSLTVQTAQPLHLMIRSDSRLNITFKLLGFYQDFNHKSSSPWNVAAVVWCYLTKLLVVIFAVFVFYLWISFDALHTDDKSWLNILISNFCYIVALLQSITLIPVMYFVHDRMRQPCLPVELQQMSMGLTPCLCYFLFSFCTTFPYAIAGGITGYRSQLNSSDGVGSTLYYPVIALGGLADCCLLTAFLLIFYADVAIAKRLVEECVALAHSEKLTKHMVQRYALELRRRADIFYYLNSVVVVCSLLNVFAAVMRLYLAINVLSILTVSSFYAKEIPFAILMLWKAGEINDLADSLVQHLAGATWSSEKLELERALTCLSLLVSPLSFNYFGMRWGAKKLVYQVGGLAVTIIVGLLRLLLTLAG
ncbi:hypothetical protein EON65_20530 [archaeon]|nr:MAG: hypothetical protein EON65_20530 [archaeon]